MSSPVRAAHVIPYPGSSVGDVVVGGVPGQTTTPACLSIFPSSYLAPAPYAPPCLIIVVVVVVVWSLRIGRRPRRARHRLTLTPTSRHYATDNPGHVPATPRARQTPRGPPRGPERQARARPVVDRSSYIALTPTAKSGPSASSSSSSGPTTQTDPWRAGGRRRQRHWRHWVKPSHPCPASSPGSDPRQQAQRARRRRRRRILGPHRSETSSSLVGPS